MPGCVCCCSCALRVKFDSIKLANDRGSASSGYHKNTRYKMLFVVFMSIINMLLTLYNWYAESK